jgi:coiled-coil domain-containing protein 61
MWLDILSDAAALTDIEDLTTKTGNFKKFPVFVKMLISAVKQGSDSVFIDLLTYQGMRGR